MVLQALKNLGNKYKGKISEIKDGIYESKMGKYVAETGKETVKAMGLKGAAAAALAGGLAASYFSGSMETTYNTLMSGGIPNTFPHAVELAGVTSFAAGSAMLSNAINYAKRGGKKISEKVEKTKKELENKYKNLNDTNSGADSNKSRSNRNHTHDDYTNLPESDVRNRLWAHQDTIADLKRKINGDEPKRDSKEYMKTDPEAFEHYRKEGRGTSNNSRITYTNKPKDKVIENTNPEQIGFSGLYSALGHGKKKDIHNKPLSERTLNELLGRKKEESYQKNNAKKLDSAYKNTRTSKEKEYNETLKNLKMEGHKQVEARKKEMYQPNKIDDYDKIKKDLKAEGHRQISERTKNTYANSETAKREYDALFKKLKTEGQREIEVRKNNKYKQKETTVRNNVVHSKITDITDEYGELRDETHASSTNLGKEYKTNSSGKNNISANRTKDELRNTLQEIRDAYIVGNQNGLRITTEKYIARMKNEVGIDATKYHTKPQQLRELSKQMKQLEDLIKKKSK